MVAVFVGWIWHLYRRAQGRVAGRIKEIKSKAADVMDRLDGLKERLKLMPSSTEFKQPMTGTTQALYTAVNEKLGTLWDGWLHIMDVLEKAQKLADRSGSPLSQKTLAEAEELMNKQGSFAEIEAQAQAISVDVDRLEHAHEVARSTLQAVSAARPKIDAGLDQVKSLGLPTAPYQEELGAVAVGLSQASSVLAADPLGTMTALEQLRARSDAFLERIERVVSLFGDAKKAKSSLETIKRQVAGHRAQGLTLIEDGGNPDVLLGQAEAAHSDTLTGLEAGDPEAAAQKLDAAQSAAAEAQATIDKVQKARAFCERELPARARETERLRTALTQGEAYQTDLEREFARSSWQAVARNLDQARSLLATFDRQTEQAAAAATTTRQEYLRATALVEELARQQQIVLRLMSGLGEQLNALVAARNECRALNEDLAARERQAELLIRQNESIVSDVARNSLERARADQGRDRCAFRRSRPRLACIASESERSHRRPGDCPVAGRGRRKISRGPNAGIRAGAHHGGACLRLSEQPSRRPSRGESALSGGGRCTRPGRDGDDRAARPIGGTARAGARGRGGPGPLRRARPRRHSTGRPGPGTAHRGRPGDQPGSWLFHDGNGDRYVGSRVAGDASRTTLARSELRAIDPARRREHAVGAANLLCSHAASAHASDGDCGRAKTPERAHGRAAVERGQLWCHRRHGRGRGDSRPRRGRGCSRAAHAFRNGRWQLVERHGAGELVIGAHP